MTKLWTGRFKKQLDETANDFNSSIAIDSRMYRQDILGSVAHSEMLAKQNIISAEDAAAIKDGLYDILSDIESGKLPIDMSYEDIHSFVEAVLTERIGDAGKRLHTARSRNDQVALDTRMYIREACDEITALLYELCLAVCDTAEENFDKVMPGYTHLQRAQPITLGQHLMAYAAMLLRDLSRVRDCKSRLNICPLGSSALAGTGFPIDREYTAALLNFDAPCLNSLDGVSDRDYIVELSSAIATIMLHLSRFSEEIILWCSWEFKFIELDDSFSTGSSIMPQKKNPDIAELVRGKTGRAFGNLITILTLMKGLPLAYNKDMQEDKECIFDSVDTVKQALQVFAPMLRTMKVLPENMRRAAAKGFINATDCADYLTAKGMPFRTAYKLTGELVAFCIDKAKTLEELSLEEFKSFSDVFEEDVFEAIDLEACVSKRTSQGGAAPVSVKAEIAAARKELEKFNIGEK